LVVDMLFFSCGRVFALDVALSIVCWLTANGVVDGAALSSTFTSGVDAFAGIVFFDLVGTIDFFVERFEPMAAACNR